MRSRGLAAIVIGVTLILGSVSTQASAAEPPLLGAKEYAPNGRGFGTAHPKQIHNGGVPSGWVHNIRWRRWGKPVAFGVGLGHGYKPSGGYYRKHVKVRLRARTIGYCGNSNRAAYIYLKFRSQKKPGGSFGRWFSWSGTPTICAW